MVETLTSTFFFSLRGTSIQWPAASYLTNCWPRKSRINGLARQKAASILPSLAEQFRLHIPFPWDWPPSQSAKLCSAVQAPKSHLLALSPFQKTNNFETFCFSKLRQFQPLILVPIWMGLVWATGESSNIYLSCVKLLFNLECFPLNLVQIFIPLPFRCRPMASNSLASTASKNISHWFCGSKTRATAILTHR